MLQGGSRMRRGLLCPLILAFVSSAQDLPPPGNRPSTPGISLSISAVDDVVKPGAPVEIKLKPQETDSEKDYVIIRSGSWECTYRVEVRNESGTVPPETKYGIMFNGHVAEKDWEKSGLTLDQMLHACTGGASFVDLKSGQSVTASLKVTARYSLTATGKYTVQVRLDQDPKVDGVVVTSNIVTVAVRPQ